MAITTQDVAARFNELAQQERWIEIQDTFFSDNIKSIDPPNSPYFETAEGIVEVRKKGIEFMKKITAIHGASTTEPIVCGNHFVVGRHIDITLHTLGRIQLEQIMLYEVKNGKIVVEQFFY